MLKSIKIRTANDKGVRTWVPIVSNNSIYKSRNTPSKSTNIVEGIAWTYLKCSGDEKVTRNSSNPIGKTFCKQRILGEQGKRNHSAALDHPRNSENGTIDNDIISSRQIVESNKHLLVCEAFLLYLTRESRNSF